MTRYNHKTYCKRLAEKLGASYLSTPGILESENALQALSTIEGFILVCVNRIITEFSANNPEDIKEEPQYGIYFLKQTVNQNEIDDIVDLCIEKTRQIVSSYFADNKEGTNGIPFNAIVIEKTTINPVGPIIDTYYGCFLKITFKEGFKSECLE